MKKLAKTFTFDNGLEFSQHEQLTKELGVSCYFARPYHSWERGLNEHTNGLIRQYFPKGSSFKDITHEQALSVQKALNTRPRKVLIYSTPQDVLFGLKRSIPVALDS